MSDNPLADWLGAHHDGDDDAGRGSSAPPGEAASARWPDWASSAARPREPHAATWTQPPDDDGNPGSSRRRLLLVAAALPWAVAGALGVAVVTSGPSPATDVSGTAAPDGPPPASEEPAAEQALGAAAALAVRLTVTTTPEEDDPGAFRRYVDLAVPEALSWSGDVAVVTVAAVVLEGAGDQWHTSRPARYAVPLQLVDGRAVALGAPWPLAVDAPAPDTAEWDPSDAAHDSLARALSAAGYTDIGAMNVEERRTSAPEHVPLLRADIQARAPGESEPRAHQLWLRADPEPLVLGADQSPPTAERR